MLADFTAFVTAFIASLALTPLARRLALQTGMIDMPGSRKLHRVPVPLLGGLAIYAAAVPAIVFFTEGSARMQIVGILTGATLLITVGILDDKGLLHHQIKLLGGMPLASLILLASGIRSHVASAFLPNNLGTLLDVCLTIVWVVGITAAFSILDHMDGLCAGIAAVASLFLLVFAAIHSQTLVATLTAAILGASLGFLRWNFNPAKIFLGDGGAMFLGFMMATLGLKLRFDELPPTMSWMIPVLILGVPIFDTTLISISRMRRGLIPFTSPGKDHTAHRLANIGLGQRGAVLTLYFAGIVFGLLALTLSRLRPVPAYILAGILTLCLLVAIGWLERVFSRFGEGETAELPAPRTK